MTYDDSQNRALEWVNEGFSRLKREQSFTQAKLGQALGVSQPQAAALLSGARKLKADEIPILEELFGKPFITGEGSPPPKGLPHLNIHAGLGNGGLGYVEVDPDTQRPLEHYTTGDWLFPSDVGARVGVLKGKYAFPVEGDSMAPTIEGGSIVFVDTVKAYPSPPGLFVVDTGDGRLVKRVELIPRSENIRIISDNKDYGTYEFHRDEVQIFGRVIAVFSWNE